MSGAVKENGMGGTTGEDGGGNERRWTSGAEGQHDRRRWSRIEGEGMDRGRRCRRRRSPEPVVAGKVVAGHKREAFLPSHLKLLPLVCARAGRRLAGGLQEDTDSDRAGLQCRSQTRPLRAKHIPLFCSLPPRFSSIVSAIQSLFAADRIHHASR
jgi:hypothetical protein